MQIWSQFRIKIKKIVIVTKKIILFKRFPYIRVLTQYKVLIFWWKFKFVPWIYLYWLCLSVFIFQSIHLFFYISLSFSISPLLNYLPYMSINICRFYLFYLSFFLLLYFFLSVFNYVLLLKLYKQTKLILRFYDTLLHWKH